MVEVEGVEVASESILNTGYYMLSTSSVGFLVPTWCDISELGWLEVK